MLQHLSSDQGYFDESLQVSDLRQLLDGASASSLRGVAERIRGVKTLLAMVSKGTDVSAFFPDVVRNVLTNNFELKTLVYMFLLHYVDYNTETRAAALLAINSFQKDLQDSNEVVRALALRTLTSFRVDDVFQIQVMAIQTCSRDSSAYVRKVAAIAVTKLPKNESLEDDVIGLLLRDSSPVVVGSAAESFLHVCPNRVDLIHSCFRKTCAMLPHVDEWGQISILTMLTRYARICFSQPPDDGMLANGDDDIGSTEYGDALMGAVSRNHRVYHGGGGAGMTTAPVFAPVPQLPSAQELDSFFQEESFTVAPTASSSSSSPLPVPVPPLANSSPTNSFMQEDHKLLLRCTLPLLKSRNAGVVAAAVSTMWSCGKRSPGAMQKVAEALVRLIHGPHREIRYVALRIALPLLKQRPACFVPFVQDFFVNAATDSPSVRKLKMDSLVRLVRPHNIDAVLCELESYVQHPTVSFATAAIHAVRTIAIQSNDVVIIRSCLSGLQQVILGGREAVSAEAIVAARELLSRCCGSGSNDDDAEQHNVIRTILTIFHATRNHRARAATLSLAREFSHMLTPIELCCDMLRMAAINFGDESHESKIEALALAARLACLTHTDVMQNVPIERVVALSQYVLTLASCDVDWNVRDQARWYQAMMMMDNVSANGDLMTMNKLKEISPLFVTAGSSSSSSHGKEKNKTNGNADYDVIGRTNFSIDSLSFLLGSSSSSSSVDSYLRLPQWTDHPTLPSIRDPVTANRPMTMVTKPRSSSSSSSSSSDSSSSSSSDSNESELSKDAGKPHEIVDNIVTMETTPIANDNVPHTDVMLEELFSGALPSPSVLPPQTPQGSTASHHALSIPMFTVVPFSRGSGLQIDCWFTRRRRSEGLPASGSFIGVGLCLTNRKLDQPITGIRLVDYNAQTLSWPAPVEVSSIAPNNATWITELFIDFSHKWGPPGITFGIWAEEIGKINVTIKATVGELLTPCREEDIDLVMFEKSRARLGGMNEHRFNLDRKHHQLLWTSEEVIKLVCRVINAVVVVGHETGIVRLAAQSSKGELVLIVIDLNENYVIVNSEDLMLGMSLLEELRGVFALTA